MMANSRASSSDSRHASRFAVTDQDVENFARRHPLTARIVQAEARLVGDSATECLVYVIDVSCGPIMWSVHHRYKEFDLMHLEVKKRLADNLSKVAKLPPKKYWGNMEEEFVEQRKQSLQDYLNNMLKEPTTRHLIDFLSFLEARPDNLKVRIAMYEALEKLRLCEEENEQLRVLEIEYQEEIKRLKGEQSEIERLRTALTKKERDVEFLQTAVDKAEHDLARWKEENENLHAQRKELIVQNETLSSQLSDECRKSEELDSENKQMKARLGTLAAEAKLLQTQISEHEARLREREEQLQTLHDLNKTKVAHVDQLTDKFERFNKEYSTLAGELEESRQYSIFLEAKQEEMDKTITEYERRLQEGFKISKNSGNLSSRRTPALM